MKKNPVICLITILFLCNPTFSQSTNPLNSNYLIEHGVSPRVLDAAASLLIQEGSFNQNLVITESSSSVEERSLEIEVIYDPEYKYGMDILYVVDGDNLSKKDKKEYANYIANSHHFSRMTTPYLYDESTLKLISDEDGKVVLEFYYKKQNVDPYLKIIKRLKGEIHFENGKLKKVVLTNFKPLKKKVYDFEMVVKFVKPDNDGGHLVSSTEQIFKRIVKGETLSYNTVGTISKYKNSEGVELEWKGKENVAPILVGKNKDTISQKLGWVLPLLGKPATKLGYKLPRPVGVNLFMHLQEQKLQFTGLQASMNDDELIEFGNLLDLDRSSIKQTTFAKMVKADVWILPFLNIMGILGSGKNTIYGDLIVSQELKDFLELIGNDPNDIPESVLIDSELESFMYGFGATLAGGIGNWNVSVNYQLMFATIVEANTTNKANIITPMLGYMLPVGLNLMVGAQGQFYDTKISGFIDVSEDEKVNYNVDFEPVTWNGIVGFYKGFAKHWELAAQVGFGNRDSLTIVAGYRF